MNYRDLIDWNTFTGAKGEKEIPNKNRNDMAKWLGTWAKVGAEIGVAHGKYSEILMEANPDLKLFGVDPYKVYSDYKDYQLERTMAALKADAHTRLDRFANYTFIEKMSMDALADFEDESLDFVYIDANHIKEYVLEDIQGWVKKVRPGGVLAGHDYARVAGREHEPDQRYGVVEAVDQYVAENGIQLYIWGLNSKADPALVREPIRSWMIFK